MAKGPRKRKEAEQAPEGVHDIASALDFVSIAQNDKGSSVYDTHCLIAHGWAVAFNGVLAAGHPIANDGTVACPHTGRFLHALKHAGSGLAITHTPNGDGIAVASGRYRAVVPCVPVDHFPNIQPDVKCAHVNDELRRALMDVEGIAKESDPSVVRCSIQLLANVCRATDGHVLLEAWHGIDLPKLVLPKSVARAIAHTKEPLTGFGFSENTATFYFQNGAWLRTNLWNTAWPDRVEALRPPCDVQWYPLPPEFQLACEAVAKFNNEGKVYAEKGFIRSHRGVDTGATYQCALPWSVGFSMNFARMLFGRVTHVAISEDQSRLFFYGPNLLALMMLLSER